MLHVCEEPVVPGWSIDALRARASRIAIWVTPMFAVIINILNALVMFDAALCFCNGWLRIAAAVKHHAKACACQ
jgi:hypothetical protein